MRVKVERSSIGRFAMLSGVIVLMSLTISMIVHPFGFGLSSGDLWESVPLTILIWLTWVVVVGLVRGWIRLVSG